jgi:serine/threonine protein kinase
MDLYRGGALIDNMECYWDTQGKIDCLDVVPLSKQMALAIDYLHGQGIVHRDVKADNFVLDRPDIVDPECRIALGDFGTACELPLPAPARGRLQEKLGTRNHWAPEVFRQDYGQKVDIWALGIVMYGMFEERFPFAWEEQILEDPVTLSEDTPALCADFVLQLLRKEEHERPDATTVLAHPYLNPIKASEETVPAEPVFRSRRTRMRTSMIRCDDLHEHAAEPQVGCVPYLPGLLFNQRCNHMSHPLFQKVYSHVAKTGLADRMEAAIVK